MAKAAGESMVRLDPNRTFPLRMSKAPVYSEKQLARSGATLSDPSPPPKFIDNITVRNHPFDSEHRRRTKVPEPKGVGDLLEPPKGATGVRLNHKPNEEKIDPLSKLGNYSSKCQPHEKGEKHFILRGSSVLRTWMMWVTFSFYDKDTPLQCS